MIFIPKLAQYMIHACYTYKHIFFLNIYIYIFFVKGVHLLPLPMLLLQVSPTMVKHEGAGGGIDVEQREQHHHQTAAEDAATKLLAGDYHGGDRPPHHSNGALDVFTLSGGLAKHYRLPRAFDCLRRTKPNLDSAGKARQQQQRPRRGGTGGGGAGLGEEGEGEVGRGNGGGSVSSFLDLKTGCLLESDASPRPFMQEVRIFAAGTTG